MSARGAKREHQVADRLREEGWVVYRSAGSHGCADLIAMQVGWPNMLVQVKTDAAGPWDHFRPAEREALAGEALKAGAAAFLCHWPPRKTWDWVLAHGWYPRLTWPGENTEQAIPELDGRLAG